MVDVVVVVDDGADGTDDADDVCGGSNPLSIIFPGKFQP